MLINVAVLDRLFGIHPKSLIHIGAHLAEESEAYDNFNWAGLTGITWIEAQEELVEFLKIKLDANRNRVLKVCAWSLSGEKKYLNITSNSQSTSLLNFGEHSELYPEIYVKRKCEVKTSRLDEVLEESENFEFVNLDVQGAELHVLIGMGEKLSHAKWIYTEVNSAEIYLDNVRVKELDEYLKKFGFKRVVTKWVGKDGWGDALYVKRVNLQIFIAKYLFLFFEQVKSLASRIRRELHKIWRGV
jgi:FkbM family methyltransferase